jgi:hypothetical protein
MEIQQTRTPAGFSNASWNYVIHLILDGLEIEFRIVLKSGSHEGIQSSGICVAWRCEATSNSNPFLDFVLNLYLRPDYSFVLANLDSSFATLTTLRIPDSHHAVGLELRCRNTSPKNSASKLERSCVLALRIERDPLSRSRLSAT